MINTKEIIEEISSRRGRPVLLCIPASEQENVLQEIYEQLKEKKLLNPSGRNRSDLVNLKMYSVNEEPDRFVSLRTLCSTLMTAAGFRDLFEGLLMLDVASVNGEDRLKAVAEGIKLWGARCFTVFYGYDPANQDEIFRAVDALDRSDNLLHTIVIEAGEKNTNLADELAGSGIRMGVKVRRRILAMLEEVAGNPAFSMSKYTGMLKNFCSAAGTLTEEGVDRMLADRFGYHNRLLRAAAQEKGAARSSRRIGFET